MPEVGRSGWRDPRQTGSAAEGCGVLNARSPVVDEVYSHTAAVRRVSFTIKPGEILGYLGPNGAGKRTTVKMLTGLIEPSEGQIFYRGRSVYEDFTAFQQRVGYVPEEAHLYPHLSGREYLQLMGRLRGMRRSVLEPKMDEVLRAFSLWDDRHSPLSAYSKGMRQASPCLRGLLVVLPTVNWLLLECLYRPAAFVVVLVILLAGWARFHAVRREGWGDLRLKYEEAPDPAIHGLNLLR